MSALPIVYSPKATRGKIIIKSLLVHGIKAVYFKDIDEAKHVSVESNSPVIILDAKESDLGDTELVHFFSFDLPYSFIILFSGNGSSKKIYNDRPDHIHILDSFNPVRIADITRQIIKKLYGKIDYEAPVKKNSIEFAAMEEISGNRKKTGKAKPEKDPFFKFPRFSKGNENPGPVALERQADTGPGGADAGSFQSASNEKACPGGARFLKQAHVTPFGPQPFGVIQPDAKQGQSLSVPDHGIKREPGPVEVPARSLTGWEWAHDDLTTESGTSNPLVPEPGMEPRADQPVSRFKAIRRFTFMASLFLSVLMVGVIGGYIYWCASMMPEVRDLRQHTPFKSSKIYSYDNTLLSEFFQERRTSIPYHRIPKHVIDAFITAEDARYFKHGGIDPVRIMGALYADIMQGGYKEGGSTITQQLAKMVFLTRDKTITRKIQEVFLSFKLERKYSKHEILGFYFNQSYFGSRAYGIEAAAQTYFNKPVEKINIAEASMLAALLKAPSMYSPFKDPSKSLSRRNYILKRLYETGRINLKTYQSAVKEPLPLKYHGRKYTAPYFVEHCKNQVEKKYGSRLYTSGLEVYTTLDHDMQKIAEDAVTTGIAGLNKRGHTNIQASLVAIELNTGRVKALVGGARFWESQFNRVTQAKRQPGSAFKPIVYLTALEQGFSMHDTIQDLELTYVDEDDEEDGIWTPKNYDGTYNGPVSLRKAMAHSLNAATVNLANLVRIRNVIKTARKLGIRSKIHPLYSSALGASETTLLELVCAYASMAHGNKISPVFIDRIIDRKRSALFEPVLSKTKIIDDASVAKIRKMLRAVITEGTGKAAASLKRTVYGKTGTTNDHADALFVGFDDHIALGVWVGRDNHTSIGSNETGATAALPIWLHFMKAIQK